MAESASALALVSSSQTSRHVCSEHGTIPADIMTIAGCPECGELLTTEGNHPQELPAGNCLDQYIIDNNDRVGSVLRNLASIVGGNVRITGQAERHEIVRYWRRMVWAQVSLVQHTYEGLLDTVPHGMVFRYQQAKQAWKEMEAAEKREEAQREEVEEVEREEVKEGEQGIEVGGVGQGIEDTEGVDGVPMFEGGAGPEDEEGVDGMLMFERGAGLEGGVEIFAGESELEVGKEKQEGKEEKEEKGPDEDEAEVWREIEAGWQDERGGFQECVWMEEVLAIRQFQRMVSEKDLVNPDRKSVV